MSGYTDGNYYKDADWNAICDVCGNKLKASELRQRWDGFMVCMEDWELRNPQDLMKPPPPDRPIPWSRPEAADQFINVPYIDPNTGTQESTIPSSTANKGQGT